MVWGGGSLDGKSDGWSVMTTMTPGPPASRPVMPPAHHWRYNRHRLMADECSRQHEKVLDGLPSTLP